MLTNTKKTANPIAKIASKGMKSQKKDKSVDASALVQVQPNKETWKKVATKSSKALKNPKTPMKEKKVAASVLSQTQKKRVK